MLVRADASDPEQVSAMVEAVEEKFGSLDILVPNATPDQPETDRGIRCRFLQADV